MHMRFVKLISFIVVLASFVYIGKTIFALNIDYSLLFSMHFVNYFLFSTFIAFSNLFIASYLYKRIIDLISEKCMSYQVVTDIYILSNIGKYLPGNFMHFAGRNILGLKYGFDQKVLLGSTVVMQLHFIFVALLYGLLLGFDVVKNTFTFVIDNNRSYVLFFLLGIIVIVIVSLLFILAMHKANRLSLLLKYFKKGNYLRVIINILITAGFLLFYALSFLIIYINISSNNYPSNYPFIISAYIVSWLIGMITPGAPGGLGVRESALVLILANVLLTEKLMLILIVHRLSTIIADVAAYVIVANRVKANN